MSLQNPRVVVYLVVLNLHSVLMASRHSTEYADQEHFLFPSRELEKGKFPKETVACIARRIGITVVPCHVHLAHVVHRLNLSLQSGLALSPELALYFKVETWTGEPVNHDPEQYKNIKWINVINLIELENVQTDLNTRKAIRQIILNRISYNEE